MSKRQWNFSHFYHYSGIPLGIAIFLPLLFAVAHESAHGNKLPAVSFFILVLWYTVRWLNPCLMCVGKRFCDTCIAR